LGEKKPAAQGAEGQRTRSAVLKLGQGDVWQVTSKNEQMNTSMEAYQSGKIKPLALARFLVPKKTGMKKPMKYPWSRGQTIVFWQAPNQDSNKT